MKIKGRPSKYRKGLQEDENWRRVKQVVRVRDGHKCRICGAKIRLEVHHITYTLERESIRGRELEYPEWLITLCHDCHRQVHKNRNHLLNPQNPLKQNAETYKSLF